MRKLIFAERAWAEYVLKGDAPLKFCNVRDINDD